jgi:hypothetical protein
LSGRFIFVGERRSPTAIARGWTWESRRLCADTLHRALEAAGLDRWPCTFVNLWSDEPPWGDPRPDVLETLAHQTRTTGTYVVALGRKVQRALARHGIAHVPLHHPAARGKVRRTRAYQAHVAAVLGVYR